MKSTYKKLKPVQKLAIVNSRLRHGDVAKVAKATGYSSPAVRNVLEGSSENNRILNVAYDLTRNRKKNFQVIKDLTSKKKTTTSTEA